MIKKKVVQSLVKANVSLQVNANLGSLNKIREKNSSNNDLYYKHVTFLIMSVLEERESSLHFCFVELTQCL